MLEKQLTGLFPYTSKKGYLFFVKSHIIKKKCTDSFSLDSMGFVIECKAGMDVVISLYIKSMPQITHEEIRRNLFPDDVLVLEEKGLVNVSVTIPGGPATLPISWHLQLKKALEEPETCQKCSGFANCFIDYTGQLGQGTYCECFHGKMSLGEVLKNCPKGSKGVLYHDFIDKAVVIDLSIWDKFDFNLYFLYEDSYCRETIIKRKLFFDGISKRDIYTYNLNITSIITKKTT